jgi:hypothetical protein
MSPKKTVTINGRVYDAVTGLPIEAPRKAAQPTTAKKRTAPSSSSAVHSAPQRSQTLHRRAAKKVGVVKRPTPGRHMDIARSTQVSRFASHPVTPTVKKETPDTPAKTHPVVKRAVAKQVAKSTPKTSKQVKDAAITAALAAPKQKQKEVKARRWQWSRRTIIMLAVFVVLIAGALVTYFNLPQLSVAFASNQAGISASYPEYRPDGYHLSQPVTYTEGEVVLTFASNSGRGGYTITQTRSSWDSTAVLNNVVIRDVGDTSITTQERGLTLYSYDGTTVWVNGGVLYKIKVDAPLSGEQVRRIATSL